MKNTFVSWVIKLNIICALMMLNSQVHAQVVDDLTKVTLPTLDITAQEIFNNIEKQTSWVISYAENSLPTQKYQLEKKEQTAKALFSFLAAQSNFEYLIIGKQITVRLKENKKEEPKNEKGKRKVTGVVRDYSNGQPLPGSSVYEKNAPQNGVSTDENGMYTIIADISSSLVFSFIGTQTVEEKVGERTIIDVALKPDVELLAEIVVVGYGTANKRDLTGSIVKVVGAEVQNTPNANPINSLQGRVTGLSIVNTGVPGAAPDVRIRGTNSLNQVGPLYIVDGIFTDNIFFVNPGDIESIEVLKDPSSLAVFGVRGANGVIIVTTKKEKMANW